VFQNPILKAIDEGTQRAMAGLPSVEQKAARANPTQTEQEYKASQNILRDAVQQLILRLNSDKQNLAINYSERHLWEQRARFSSCADYFLSMADERSNDLYEFVNRTPERRRSAKKLSQVARSVAQHFETTARGKKPYSVTRTDEKLQELIIALGNFDAVSC
jgi:hypothetical protein